MTDIQIQITEDGDLKKYRTELPNIVDDLGLDPYQFRLYGHYKRVCGANGGTCTEGIRTTADNTKMSTAKVSLVRRELVDKGLITVKEIGQYIHVKIIDLWEINFAYFSIKDRPEIDGWTIEQVRNFTISVYEVNTYGKPSNESVYDVNASGESVYDVNGNAQKCLSHKTKKEHDNKKEHVDKKERSPKSERPSIVKAVQVYVDVTKKYSLNKTQMNVLDKRVGDDPDDLERWRKVVEAWQLKGYKSNNVEGMLDWFDNGIPTYRGNGAYTNGHQSSQSTANGTAGTQQARSGSAISEAGKAKLARLSR